MKGVYHVSEIANFVKGFDGFFLGGSGGGRGEIIHVVVVFISQREYVWPQR
jgi:hypothetical protein